jgi:signal transduction histidine kinase/CheY-like chemotaxis protein
MKGYPGEQQAFPKRRPSSLYNRILVVMAAIFLLVTAFIASGIMLFVYRNENIFWQERQSEAVHNAASQVAAYIEKNENLLLWLDRFGYDEMRENPGSFSALLHENPAFLEIAFLDANGSLLLSAAQNEPILANQFTVRQAQWFRTARSGKKIYTRIQTSPRGESYLIYAAPSRHGGVIVAQIRMDGLWAKVAGITFGRSGSVYVVSPEGQMIAHRNHQFVLLNKSIGNTMQFKQIMQAPGNEYTGNAENLEGVEVINASTVIGSTGWIVIAELPQREAHAITYRALVLIPLALIILMTFAAVAFRKILVREFLRPVQLLRAGALRLSQGDLAYRLEAPRRLDELGQVMEAFNGMAAELAARSDELQRHSDEIASAYQQVQRELEERQKAQAALKELNEELESRVEERTLSLVQSNKNLLHEITERKTAEEQRKKLEIQLQQAQKMEAIGRLAGGIAHDFNNILGAILGNAEMARGESIAGSNIADDLDEVIKASHRARDLIKQILAFSRQDESERLPLQPADIVQDAMKMLRPSIPSTIEIHREIARSTRLILADATQIHQILINLCTNALHALEDTGGRIDISLQDVELEESDLGREAGVRAGSFVRLSVGDSGPGIPPDVREKIFDPYFTTKEVGKGTGMGLSIVHGIVKSYGGFIILVTELGKGASFHVFFPALEEGSIAEEENAEIIATGSERILLVDDEQMLAEMVKKMLERLGYEVTARMSSQEALEVFAESPDQFDVVVTDQTMPGMTGLDLAGQLLRIRPDIPIILCTGYSTIISEEAAKAAGVREFALKPLAKRDIARLLRKVLDPL